MRSLLITSFQSQHARPSESFSVVLQGVMTIKSWHKNCCFESFKIKQLIFDSGNAANRVASRFNYSRSVAFASDAVGFV